MDISQLRELAKINASDYLKRENLDFDEELQLMSCSYTNLFLTASDWKEGQSLNNMAEAHLLIAESYTKIGQQQLAERHSRLSQSYKS